MNNENIRKNLTKHFCPQSGSHKMTRSEDYRFCIYYIGLVPYDQEPNTAITRSSPAKFASILKIEQW